MQLFDFTKLSEDQLPVEVVMRYKPNHAIDSALWFRALVTKVDIDKGMFMTGPYKYDMSETQVISIQDGREYVGKDTNFPFENTKYENDE